VGGGGSRRTVSRVGQVESLGQALRLPVFLTTLTEDSVAAVKNAYELLPSRVRAFIEEYDQEIPQGVKDHPAYEFRVYLIPKTSSEKEADAAVEFVKPPPAVCPAHSQGGDCDHRHPRDLTPKNWSTWTIS